MADVGEEESEVFEITDFTTATDWERFIAQFEELIHEWKLTNLGNIKPLAKNELTTSEWTETSQQIKFADFPFTITHHYLKPVEIPSDPVSVDDSDKEDVIPMVHQDLMSMENDFPPRAHCLCRWFGIRSFLVICPTSATDKDALVSESRISLLRSSACIAINNTRCQVPVFVQIHHKWRRMYQGHCEFPGVRTNFDIVHLRRAPPQYRHLGGLLDIFKSKVGSHITLPPVTVSVRFTYILNEWPQHVWPQAPPDFNSAYGNEIGYVDFRTLPFGACEDPVSELHLSATWPSVSEEMIVDNDVYSDLDPLQAPQWSVRVHMTANPQCLLAEHLFEFLELCRRHESTNQLLGKSLMRDDDTETGDISQVLQRLTEPKAAAYGLPSLSKVMSRSRQSLRLKPGEAPIPDDLLNKMLLFLFPDADKDKSCNSKTTESESEKAPEDGTVEDLSRLLKSAPEDSLTSNLALVCCVVNNSLGGLHAVAHLWQEFVLEMRYRFENNYLIYGLEQSSPNMGCCLLHQKLQMLNCCIERKRAREVQQMTPSPSIGQLSASSSFPLLSAVSSVTDLTTSKQSETDDQPMVCSTSGTAGQGDGCIDSVGDNTSATSGVECMDSVQSNSMSTGDDNGAKCQVSELSEIKNSDEQISDKCQDAVKSDPASLGENSGATNDWNWSIDSSDDEEFFECEEEEEEGKEDTEEMEKTSANTAPPSGECEDEESAMDVSDGSGAACDKIDNDARRCAEEDEGKKEKPKVIVNEKPCKPEGRLRPHGDMRLLKVDDLLYIPVTQEPAPMTEDMLEEHAEVLARETVDTDFRTICQCNGCNGLGSGAEGAHLRARMQSACLLSDMESFKAANPGCTLEDFVRWYSPRDYVEEEMELEDGTKTIQGHLSQRMQIPGNMWAEVWQSARRVPARRQKRLFDDTKEAEKVLHFLGALKPGELAKHLLPMVIQAGISSVVKHDENQLASLQVLIKQLTSRASKVTRSPVTDLKKYEDVVRQIELSETVIARAKSLQGKFDITTTKSTHASELERFVTTLLEQPEVPVLGASRGPAGQVIHQLFSAVQTSHASPEEEVVLSETGEGSMKEFPSPAGREFILRSIVPRPAPYSRPCPQRMFCVLTPEGFRLAGAFSEDTTFR